MKRHQVPGKSYSSLLGFLLLGWSLGLSTSLDAQNFHVRAYDEGNGLPAQEVRHVIQDAFGFLWLATDNGLLRFDGQQFERFNQPVPSRYGYYFVAIPNGFLYCHDAGIDRVIPGLDTVDISLLYPASIDPAANDLYYPNRLYQAKDSALWISQPNGQVLRINRGQRQSFFTEGMSTQKGQKAFFVETSRGVLWVARQDGHLFRYDPSSAELIQSTIRLSTIEDVTIQDNRLWLAGATIHRVDFAENGQRITSQYTWRNNPGLVNAITLDSTGNLLVGIQEQGLFQLDLSSSARGTYLPVFANNDPHRVDELPFKTIHQIVSGTNNQLWICAENGLGILRKRFFESINGLPNGNTTSLAPGEEGQVYVNFGDLYRIDPTSYGYTAIPLPTRKEGAIASITTIGKQLWLGTSTGKLIGLTSNGISNRTIDLSARGEGIFYLYSDAQKRLWFCQAPAKQPITGVAAITPDGQLREYGAEAGLESRVLVIKATKNGRLYAGGIGKQTYLYRYLPEQGRFTNLSAPFDFYVNPNFEVHDLTVDDQGIIWLATTDGLLRFDLDRVRRINLGGDYDQVEIRAVEHMPDGSIWLATDTEGVLRWNEEGIVAIGEESGLPSKVMAYRCLVKDKDHRLWVGTAEGLVYSLATHPQPKRSQPPLLTTLLVDEEKNSAENLNLQRGQTLQAQFKVPAFHGYRTFFQHRIDEQEWSVAKNESLVKWEQFPEGKHTIAVRSRQEGGTLWSDPLLIPVVVSRPWYEQRWWQTVFGIGLLAILLGWYWFRRRNYQQRLAQLNKALEREQAVRVAGEMKLERAQAILNTEQREQRVNLLALEILQRLIAKMSPGMSWDKALEVLSDDLLKMPGAIAFEVVSREGQHLYREGYSEKSRQLISSKIQYRPKENLAAYMIRRGRPQIFNQLQVDAKAYVSTSDPHLKDYQSAVAVPFYHGQQQAVLFLYADRVQYFDEFHLKIISVLGKYLEQVT